MPRLDGTGPMGQGPRTGRGLGNCQGAVGRFCRWCPVATGNKSLTKEDQKKDEKIICPGQDCVVE